MFNYSSTDWELLASWAITLPYFLSDLFLIFHLLGLFIVLVCKLAMLLCSPSMICAFMFIWVPSTALSWSTTNQMTSYRTSQLELTWSLTKSVEVKLWQPLFFLRMCKEAGGCWFLMRSQSRPQHQGRLCRVFRAMTPSTSHVSSSWGGASSVLSVRSHSWQPSRGPYQSKVWKYD